ncbi:ATP citrate synthase [Candidatus Gracilibacteria bacterium]|nr:MAG: ATP citrate synthase [Candidatus Gracilibacteria bacterium]
MFTKNTKAIIYGLQTGAAQNMLDFDFLSEREPSVSCFINPGKSGSQKLFFGDKEIIIPIFSDFENISKKIKKETDTLVNFASFRSASDSTKEALKQDFLKNIIIIAEGIPERQTREIIELNKTYKKNIIGPATVGAMEAGVFRAGNTGGSLENIISSKLYKTGNTGFVSKSGGMSNEMRKIIADRTNGTSLSVALGGDKYNFSEFKDIIKIFEKRKDIKMIVMLGEVGGTSELEIAEMLKKGEITKPLVAWCIGTIGEQLKADVQFGHAGAKSNKNEETANFKNNALKEAGAIVPENFMDFGDKIEETFKKLNLKNDEKIDEEKIQEKFIKIKTRKSTNFTSSISDERGEELTYNKKNISEYVKKGSIASVISNLWLKKDLPEYGEKFLNTIIILLADHGPAVSGATNAIITARAGNDLKSSLIAGLTTIGPRFGGAIDSAAKYFFESVKNGKAPEEYVKEMKQKGINIPGIGHKVKSKFNPDKRCEILLKLSKDFKKNDYLDFALKVEKLTLEKKPNLILNVDGMIAAMMLDLFEDIGLKDKEIEKYINAGIFNGFFILARTIGFIGHIIDQKNLEEGLYRTPWNDILYK